MTDKIQALIDSFAAFDVRLQQKINTKLGKTEVAAKAALLETPRSFYISGDAVASGVFDGSANVTMNVALKSSGVVSGQYGTQNDIPVLTVNAKGIVTTVNAVPLRRNVIPIAAVNDLPASGEIDTIYLVRTNGTTVMYRWNGVVYENMTANLAIATSAAKLTTPRMINILGDVTGEYEFDGSSDVSVSLDLSNTGVIVGTYPKVTVDAKGRVTAGSALLPADVPTLNQSTTGTAASSEGLTVARNITLSGDVSGSVAFDGRGDVEMTVSVADSSHAHTMSTVTGLTGALSALAPVNSPSLTGTPLSPTAAIGSNTTQIATTAFVRAEIGSLSPTKTGTNASGTWAIGITGNAATATKLTALRNLSISGDASGTTTYDGSADSNTVLTLANTGVVAATYGSSTTVPVVQIDAKGRALSVTNTQIRVATLALAGIVQLTDSVSSASVSTAATPNAVKQAYDVALAAIPMALKGAVNGIAELDGNGLVKASQLPSYVDDVLEYTTLATFPATGESGKIYLETTSNRIYRWSGSLYIEISPVVGNSDSATKLSTPRNISISGDATGVVLFDGSVDANLVTTLANTGIASGVVNNSATTNTPLTLDVKGRVVAIGSEVLITPLFSSLLSKPTTIGGYGITDALQLTSALPLAPTGAAAVGVGTAAARFDHKHPIQTTITGNAATATKLAAAITINGTSFDGSASITVTDSTKEPVIIAGGLATYLRGDKVWTDFGDSTRNSQLTGMVLTNAAPVVETDTVLTAVGKIQAQVNEVATAESPTLTGVPLAPTAPLNTNTTQIATTAFTISQIADDAPSKAGFGANGNWDINILGTAAKLTTARALTWAGDVTGTMNFDGGANVSAGLTLAPSGVVAGAYGSATTIHQATVDAKGRIVAFGPGLTITPAFSSITSRPTTLAGYGITDAELSSQKGVANGYAGLDGGGKVPASQLPSYVDDVLEYTTLATFPGTGESGKLYVDLATGKLYRWSGTVYVEISAAPGSTDSVVEGATNLYFTAARAQAAVTAITGNAATATKLATARTLSVSGDGVATGSFDGSANLALALTLAGSGVTAGAYNASATSHTPFTVDAKGRLTTVGVDVLITPAFANITSKPTTISGYGITDDLKLGNVAGISSGVAAAGVASTAARSDHVHPVQTTITGNAATATLAASATALATARTIALTGDTTGTVNFDGTANASIATTLAASGVTAGTYNNSATMVSPFTVDAKGRVTSIGAAVLQTPAWTSITGKPTTLAGFGITDGTDVAEYATFANFPATGIAGKVYVDISNGRIYRWNTSVYQTLAPALATTDALAEGATNLYFTAARAQAAVTTITGNAATATKLATTRALAVSGDATGTVNFDGSAAATIPLVLANSGVVAGTYNSATQVSALTVDAKGRVTAAAAAVTITPAWSSVTGKPTTVATSGLTDAESTANKGVANGYAGLDATGKVPAAQLPSYVDDVLEYANLAGFPGTGETAKLYVAIDTNNVYRWSGTVYVEIASSPGSTDSVVEGATNLYFTAARAQAAVTTISGNAATATKLATARTIATTGDVTSTGTFDGSANLSLASTLALSGVVAGTYGSATQIVPFTVDAKGRVTAAAAAVTITPAFGSITGKPTTLAGYGITDASALTSSLPLDPGVAAVGVATTAARADHVHDVQPSVTGNAGSATVLQTARMINGVSFNGSADVTVPPIGTTWQSTARANLLNVGASQGLNTGSVLCSDNYADASLVPVNGLYSKGNITTAGTFNGNGSGLTTLNAANLSSGVIASARLSGSYAIGITGNAATATQLATSRLINGVAFNGTADITVSGNDPSKLPLSGGTVYGFLAATARLAATGSGNDYNSGGVELIGNGAANTVFPTLGFHQPTAYGASLQLRAAADFRFYAQAGGSYANVTANQYNGATLTLSGRATVGDVMSSGWLRTIGAVGWYNETYGGGMYMSDTTYVRTYNGKQLYCNDGMQIDGPTPQIRLNDTGWGVRYLYADGGLIGFLSSTGGWSMQVDNGGNLTATGNVAAYSDSRLKKDVDVIPNALDKLCTLRGVTYTRIDNGERSTGVIAQEVRDVLPEAVMENKDGLLAVAYGNLAGLYIEAIKELTEMVNDLKAEVAELRSMV
jgi:phage-related tail fiber protein